MRNGAAPTSPAPQSSPPVPPPHQKLRPMRGLLIWMIWATISMTVALHFGAFIVCSYAPYSLDIMWLLYYYTIVLVFTVTLCGWLLRPYRPRPPHSDNYPAAAFTLITATCIQDWWIKPIGLSHSDTIPSSVEHLIAAWISLIVAILSCMLLQAYDDRLTSLRAADQSSTQTGALDGSTTPSGRLPHRQSNSESENLPYEKR